MSIIARFRTAVRANRYEYSQHALEEMNEDDLADLDVRQAILNGGVRHELTDDPRSMRYVIKGESNGVDIEVVARLISGDWARIITVYVP